MIMGTTWKRRVGGVWIIAGVVLAACSDDGAANTGGSESTGSPSTTAESSGTPADSSSSGGAGTTEAATTSGTTDSSSTGAESSSTGADSSSTGADSSSTGAESSSTGAGSSSEGSSTGAAMMESSSGDPSVGFIDPSEGGANECDVWEQDCPDGEKCMPWADNGAGGWNALRCTPLDPAPVAVGGVCMVEDSALSGIDNCELGAICWGVDTETNLGTCLGMCTGSPDAPSCADPTATCSISNEDVLILCLPGCDPLLQDCGPGDVCIANNDAFLCVPDASGEEGVAGDPCEFLNVCDPGLSCLGPDVVPGCLGASGCCSPYCDLGDLGAGADCVTALGVGVECVPFYAEGLAPPGYEDVGVCALPV